MLNPQTNVGKLKIASSLYNLHVSKMTAKFKKDQQNLSSNMLRIPN